MLEYDGRRAGTNGIRATRSWVNGLNQTVVEIFGVILPPLDRRHDFENTLARASTVDGLQGKRYHRAHLWGRQFGDEAAAGVMYAPPGYNSGTVRVLEDTISGLRDSLKPGQSIVLKATATSFDRTKYGGATLQQAEYDFRIVDSGGKIVHRTVVSFDVNAPEIGGWSTHAW